MIRLEGATLLVLDNTLQMQGKIVWCHFRLPMDTDFSATIADHIKESNNALYLGQKRETRGIESRGVVDEGLGGVIGKWIKRFQIL